MVRYPKNLRRKIAYTDSRADNQLLYYQSALDETPYPIRKSHGLQPPPVDHKPGLSVHDYDNSREYVFYAG